ncbi:hypothetical protein D3C86_1632570 [compost metagenome]
MIAIDGARLARPAVDDAEIAVSRPFQHVAFGIDKLRLHAEERPRRRARFQIGRTRQRRDENAAGLRLPPSIDDRALVFADHMVIPLPCFRVDRLTHRAEKTDAGARRALNELVARPHQRSERRRRRVEDIDLVLVDDFPEPALIGEVGNAFEHQRRRAIR